MVNPDHDFYYEQPPAQWGDGVPLGNGKMGAMLWGDGRPLKCTLDSYYAWETKEIAFDREKYTYDYLRKLVKTKDDPATRRELQRVFWPRTPELTADMMPVYDPKVIHPTRLPIPRLELGGLRYGRGRLELQTGIFRAATFSAYVHATQNLLVVQGFKQKLPVKLVYPEKVEKQFALWQYPPVIFDQADGVDYCIQTNSQGNQTVIAYCQRPGGLFLLTIQSGLEVADPLAAAMRLLAGARDGNTLEKEHKKWWRDYNARSSMTIPDQKLEALYYAEMYKLGCCARPDGMAMTLQGLWTADGDMPPWAGDYHLDYNVQFCYLPVYATNHLDLGFSYYDTFFKMLPRFRKNCREFFGVEGAYPGCAIGFNGARITGYVQTEFSPGNMAFLSFLYYWHYRYSLDQKFLLEKAYPMLKGAFQVYDHLLEPDENGVLHLEVCHSPEFGESSPAAWHRDSNYDAAWIKFLCNTLLEIAAILRHDDPDQARYHDILAHLYPLPFKEKDPFYIMPAGLQIAAGTLFNHSHRHQSHLFGIFPTEQIRLNQNAATDALIQLSLDAIRWYGYGEWGGGSYPWFSIIAGRVGKARMAKAMLDEYFHYITPNSMHVNGDSREHGFSFFTNTPMTLEGGTTYLFALVEMLLQSWDGVIRVFPTLPEDYLDAEFNHYLAEGGVEVSARRRGGVTTRVVLAPSRTGEIRLANSFHGRITVRGAEHKISGGNIILAGQKGQAITVTGARRLVKQAPPEGRACLFGLKHRPRF